MLPKCNRNVYAGSDWGFMTRTMEREGRRGQESREICEPRASRRRSVGRDYCTTKYCACMSTPRCTR